MNTVNREEVRSVADQRGRKRGALAGVVVLAGAIALVETHHRIPNFRFFTFALVFLLLAAAAVSAGSRLRAALLVLSSCTFGLVVVEGAAIALTPGHGMRLDGGLALTSHYFTPEPGIGWRLGSLGDNHARKVDLSTGRVIYDVHYTIDPDFDRLTRSAAFGPAIVFFGDSLTFGEGVEDGQTMPQQLADRLEGAHRVVNLAVSAYSPAQVLYELRAGTKDGVIGSSPTGAIMLTGAFHAVRTACNEIFTNSAPRFALVNGTLAYQGPCRQGLGLLWREFLYNTASYKVFVRPWTTRLTLSDVDLYLAIVTEVAATTKRKYGVDMLVAYIRSDPRLLLASGNDDAAILARLRAAGVHASDMTLSEDAAAGHQVSIVGDGHPTAYAHGVRARLIAEQLGLTPAQAPHAAP